MDISRDSAPIRRLLTEARRIAVVGCSPKPERDSHRIARYLIEAGYDVVPVNPGQETLLGRPCYPSVRAIPGPVDVVDVFRSPDQVPPVTEDAIASRAKSLWLQLGVGNPDAEKRASEAGLLVASEQCIMVAHQVLRIPRRAPA